MNRKWLVALSFFVGLFVTLFALHFPSTDSYFPSTDSYFPSTDFHEHAIVSVEVTYDAILLLRSVHKHYKIEVINGEYISTEGQKVDSALIHSLRESLTDFYEAEEFEDGYESFSMTDFYPYFTVEVALENGKSMILRSRSNFHCFIPWNIEYDGKLYVQYSGKIPAALLRILLELDKDEWLYYDKFAFWGCYPAPVPEKYRSKGISHDFPQSKITQTLEEERGKTHVLWKMNLGEPIATPPVYSKGRVFVLTKKRLISLDAQTGEILWEVRAKQEDSPCRCTNILVHGGMIYAVTPDYWLQKVESTSGDVVWKYKTQGSHASLWVRGDNLFMLSEGVTCLTTQTGDELWSVPHIYQVQWSEDKIFFSSFEKYDFFYGLIDSDSGEVIWKEDTLGICPFYDDGILYFGNFKEKELIARDIESMETVWSYHYGKDLELLHVLENRILLLLYDTESHQTTLVFLDKSGSIIWEQQSEIERAAVLRKAQAEMVQDRIFLLRDGYVEAFATEDGEELWLRELRGTSVVTFQVYKDTIYVSANDQVLYCLDFRTGEIVWEYRVAVDIFDWVTPEGYGAVSLVSNVNDEVIVVAAEDGSVVALFV